MAREVKTSRADRQVVRERTGERRETRRVDGEVL